MRQVCACVAVTFQLYYLWNRIDRILTRTSVVDVKYSSSNHTFKSAYSLQLCVTSEVAEKKILENRISGTSRNLNSSKIFYTKSSFAPLNVIHPFIYLLSVKTFEKSNAWIFLLGFSTLFLKCWNRKQVKVELNRKPWRK